MKKFIASLCIVTLLVSCSYRPILHPNETYKLNGEKVAEAEIDKCQKEADDYLDKYKASRAGKEAVRKGAWGAFFGGIFGFLFGGNVRGLATGVAIGTGIGAGSGALGVAGEGKINPDEMKQRYITRCLAEKGYEVIGWK